MAMDNVKGDLVSAWGNDLRDLLALRVEEIAQFTPSPIPNPFPPTSSIAGRPGGHRRSRNTPK
jgi:hypothetical protein